MTKQGNKLEARMLHKQGLDRRQIAEKLSVSIRTVGRYLEEEKLGKAEAEKR